MLIVVELVCVIWGCLPHSFRLPRNLACPRPRRLPQADARVLSASAACFLEAQPLGSSPESSSFVLAVWWFSFQALKDYLLIYEHLLYKDCVTCEWEGHERK